LRAGNDYGDAVTQQENQGEPNRPRVGRGNREGKNGTPETSRRGGGTGGGGKLVFHPFSQTGWSGQNGAQQKKEEEIVVKQKKRGGKKNLYNTKKFAVPPSAGGVGGGKRIRYKAATSNVVARGRGKKMGGALHSL